jgi:methanogenic corrinoid protein MtbC1
LAHSDAFDTDVVRHAVFLREIFHSLFEAGQRNDFGAAERMVERAIAANCRPVDILIGIVAPMLHKIGEDWGSGVITVEDEHKFTAFSERVLNLIDVKLHCRSSRRSGNKPVYFLMNAPGNTHTLAIRILALWLQSRRICAMIVEHGDLERLAHSIKETAPKRLLISMALPEQLAGVAAISALVGQLPSTVRPGVLVGGHAVKAGFVTAIPGADLVADISLMSIN